jgi:hypothetical protein
MLLSTACSGSSHVEVEDSAKPLPECVEFAQVYESCRGSLMGNSAAIAPQVARVRQFAQTAPTLSDREETRAKCTRSTAQLRSNCSPKQVIQ